jgi:hypothetical protein
MRGKRGRVARARHISLRCDALWLAVLHTVSQAAEGGGRGVRGQRLGAIGPLASPGPYLSPLEFCENLHSLVVEFPCVQHSLHALRSTALPMCLSLSENPPV